MATATKSGQNLSFTYNADGLRTTKTVNGVVHTYYYSGSKLVRETYGDYVLDFFYDQNGTPFMLLQNGNIYYYITNAQGDVIRLVDINGNVAASYRYDPYGKATSALGSHANINPLRYRSYVFDHETGLYYLQSRYYDPEIGRFINADGLVSTGQGLLSNNMFTYCGNNPANRCDATGYFWETIGKLFSSIGDGIANVASRTFGASASAVVQTSIEYEILPFPLNTLVTIKQGTREITTEEAYGNDTKPVTVYATGRLDNEIVSSAGMQLQIDNFTLDVSLGLDDIGISGSLTRDSMTQSFGITANVSQLKIGFEQSTMRKYGNVEKGAYTNVSVTAIAILLAYAYVTTGQLAYNGMGQAQPQYARHGG